jgi:hypothetical protein
VANGSLIRLAPDYDLYIAIEQCQKPHQSFGGKARELVILKLRDMRLRNPEESRRFRLSQTLLMDELVQFHRKLHSELAFSSIGIAESAG